MSEMAARMAAEAAAEMRLAHEMRALRDAELMGSYGPELTLRKGVITGRDPASYTVTVLFSASDTSDFPGSAIPGIRLADTVYPKVGAYCFVSWNGPEPTVLFTVGAPLGAARVCRVNTSATIIDNTDGIKLNFDTVTFDTDGLWQPGTSTSRLNIGWPGLYRVGGSIMWTLGATTGYRQVGIWHSDGVTETPIRRLQEHQSHSGIEQGQEVNSLYVFQAGNTLDLRPKQNSGGSLTLTATVDVNVLWAEWAGPPP